MTEHDDLFKFGDFEDDDALEIDLDELFGDLEVLALDPKAKPPAPVEAAAPGAAPGLPAESHAPSAAPGPVAYAQPGAPPAGMAYVLAAQPAVGRFNKAAVAITVAALVTLANVAVIASPAFRSTPQAAPTETVSQVEPEVSAPVVDPELVERISLLEAQLRGLNTPPEVIRSDVNERHRAFDEIDRNLAAGEYVAARQRLYSLLAIVDRFPNHERNRIEELASYLLSDTFRLEAQAQAVDTQEDRL